MRSQLPHRLKKSTAAQLPPRNRASPDPILHTLPSTQHLIDIGQVNDTPAHPIQRSNQINGYHTWMHDRSSQHRIPARKFCGAE